MEATIILPHVNLSAPEHDEATFVCEVNKDEAEVTWLNTNKELLTPSEKYEIKQAGRKHSLVIHDLQPADAGLYTAKVGDQEVAASLAVSGELDLTEWNFCS